MLDVENAGPENAGAKSVFKSCYVMHAVRNVVG